MLDVDFRNFITEQNENDMIVPQLKFEEIFGNMTSLRSLSNDLLKDFRECIENWSEPYNCKIAHVLVKKGPYLKMFAGYCKDHYKNMPLIHELITVYPKFKEALIEFEKKDCCRKLPITSFFDVPVQRITKYQLLMREYVKQITNAGTKYNKRFENNIHPDKADALKALEIVTNVAKHVNEYVMKNEKFQDLLTLTERLGNDHSFIKAGRYLLHHGLIKRRSKKSKELCYLILFNDELLLTKLSIEQDLVCMNLIIHL